MPNLMVRIIRSIEDSAEKEYIKEFLRFIGCFFSDIAVEDNIPYNWNDALVPSAEENTVDVVINCPEEDRYYQECRRLGIKRLYCSFSFHTRAAQVTDVQQMNPPKKGATKKDARQQILRHLIEYMWKEDPETEKQVLNIANLYLGTQKGELFYFLQAKRCLRVLTMGEVLKDPNAQVTSIPMLPYIESCLSALWEVYVGLEGCTDSYSTYARINAGNMILEIITKLYDSEWPRLRSIAANGKCLEIPRPFSLLQQLQELLGRDPRFVSAYLLMANVYKRSGAPEEAEAMCYQKMLELVPNKQSGHAFVWYRSAYYYEKKLMDVDTALKHYQEAVRLNPSCYQALFKLGYYAAAANRFNEAEELLNRTIQAIFRGRSTDPNEDGEYRNWLSLSLKDSQYVYKAYMLLARIALNRNQEYTLKSHIGRACMAATRFDEATLIRHISAANDQQFKDFLAYHQWSTPVWAMWQVLKPWSEDIVQDYFVRDIVRRHMERWKQM